MRPSRREAFLRFSILASGSRGNACLIRYGDHALLIDIGLAPRALTARLAEAGADWDCISSVVLTHTHGDHVNAHTLKLLAKHRIPLYCHEGHRVGLSRQLGFQNCDTQRLVRHYDERPWLGPGGMRIEPIPASHDDPETYGFRIELRELRWHPVSSVGYLADTGTWSDNHVEHLADVNVLAVEFNHDVDMQRNSGRPYYLVRRILGDRGHLSNLQAAELVARVLAVSHPKAVRSLVMLHMSDQCNHPDLAFAAARAAVRDQGRRTSIHAAAQDRASPLLWINARKRTCETVGALSAIA